MPMASTFGRKGNLNPNMLSKDQLLMIQKTTNTSTKLINRGEAVAHPREMISSFYTGFPEGPAHASSTFSNE
jgi:hypothetical protein